MPFGLDAQKTRAYTFGVICIKGIVLFERIDLPKVAMLLVASVAILVALVHLSCIWLGPECYSIQRAPIRVLISSKNETWLAPVATLLVSFLFLVASLYALSGGKIIRQLPFLKFGIFTIGLVCLQRGMHFIPNLIQHPPLRDTYEISAAIIWLICGVLIIWGYKSLE